MGNRDIRISKIIDILSTKTNVPLSITDIHELLFKLYQIDVSRKTIGRDLQTLEQRKIIEARSDLFPLKYFIIINNKFEVDLSVEEYRFLRLNLFKLKTSENSYIVDSLESKLNRFKIVTEVIK